jgi:hypothetical protein
VARSPSALIAAPTATKPIKATKVIDNFRMIVIPSSPPPLSTWLLLVYNL